MNLEEVCLIRLGELSEILAGLVALEPVETLPILESLKSEDLINIQARKFIEAMKEKLPELQKETSDAQINIGVQVAHDIGVLSKDYLDWVTDVIDKNAAEVTREIKRLVITLSTIGDLQRLIKDNQELYYDQ